MGKYSTPGKLPMQIEGMWERSTYSMQLLNK